MRSVNQIKNILKKRNIEPNKILGQNFLIEEKYVDGLIEAAEIGGEDTVVEIGPGTGAITKELAKKAKRVLAIEKDKNMVDLLGEELVGFDNVEIVHQDTLEFDIGYWKLDIGNSGYKVAGAPPYYLTARLFRHFLEEVEQKPSLIAVIIQKEVAEKVVAQPPEANMLSNSVQLYGAPRIAQKVPCNAFWPQPDVDSTLLIVEDIKTPGQQLTDANSNEQEKSFEKKFFEVLRAGFSAPRKQIAVNLARELNIPRKEIERALKEAGVDPRTRAQTLTVDNWTMLSGILTK